MSFSKTNKKKGLSKELTNCSSHNENSHVSNQYIFLLSDMRLSFPYSLFLSEVKWGFMSH